MDYILSPWPWFVSGPLIATVMFLLVSFGKTFGMSSNLRTLCSLGGAGKISSFFDFDWREHQWNLWVVVGSILGGYIAVQFLSSTDSVGINPNTLAVLSEYGFEAPQNNLVPAELFSLEALQNPYNLALLISAGFMIGFGTRYAGGCTSGHAITGLSNLQLPSLVAVIGFFIGGLLMTHLFFPFIF
ncbi:MAG: YeeE/YedE thiosulfate transporter family protein [Flavobacteriaceae bacterium]|nr:YeeE/YedE thiosulfate transporter family protein [Flavobacteriaceae bacterium]MDG1091485.1 YeeE/YedE thiosulfate transporter family protein [Flavobacteriaceae bacterium]